MAPAAPSQPSDTVLAKKRRKKPKKKRKKPSTPEEKANETERQRVKNLRKRARDRDANQPSEGTNGSTDGADASTSGEDDSVESHKLNKKQRWSTNRKQKKIDGVPKVVASVITSVKKDHVELLKHATRFIVVPHFYVSSDAALSAKDAFERMKEPDWIGVTYDATTMKIEANPSEGRRYETMDGIFLGILLPRAWAIQDLSVDNVVKSVATHAFVIEALGNQGDPPPSFSVNSGFAILGDFKRAQGHLAHKRCPNTFLTVDRGEALQAGEDGSTTVDPICFDPNVVSKTIQNRVQFKGDSYILASMFRGLRALYEAAGLERNGKETTISSAWTRDFQEAVHRVDHPIFLSYVTVASELQDETLPAAQRVRHNLELNDPQPALHFIFPEYNVAVPLCPGDIFVYNPGVLHCCSAKLAAYNEAHVYVMSMHN